MNLFYLLKNKRGSLPAILIATGIMGFSSVALVTYIQGISRTLKPAMTKTEVSFNIHTDVISSLQALLMETKINRQGQAQEQSQYGICSLLEPPSKQHGVGQVNITLHLSGRSRDTFSDPRWQYFFPRSEYKIAPSDTPCQQMDESFQSSPFSKCLLYRGRERQSARNTYVLARIVPRKFPDFQKINMSVSQTMDVKKVLFELQTLIAVESAGSSAPETDTNPDTNPEAEQEDPTPPATDVSLGNPSKHYVIIWANDVSECDFRIRGKWVNVQLSGTGTGRLSDNVLINHPFFTAEGTCSEVQFGDIPANIIMSGKRFDKNKNPVYKKFISADHTKNARIVCRKHRYQCPESIDPGDYISPIKFDVNIINNYGGLLRFNSLNMTLLNEEGLPADGDEDKRWNALNIKFILPNNNEDEDEDENTFMANTDFLSGEEKVLGNGQNYFSFLLEDKTTNSLTNLCDSVCGGAKYYPSFNINFPHPPKEGCEYSKSYIDMDPESNKDQYALKCNVCHSKNCHKVSLGSFGPLTDEEGLPDSYEDDVQGLTDEPLDGQIPECALKKLGQDKYNLPSVSSGSGDCVVMKIDTVDSFKNFESAKYEFHDCSQKLPVLCFAYGHYWPAIKVSASSAPALFTGPFEQAQQACYEIGREIVTKDQLAEYLKDYWPKIEGHHDNIQTITELQTHGLPGSDTHFNYINNAGRGLFILPTYNIGVLPKKLKESWLKKFIAQGHNKIWVALEKDAGGELIGSIPLTTITSSPFQVFTRKASPPRPVVLKDNNNILESGAEKTVLTHSVRYKGVYNVSDNIPRKALCRKNHGDFVPTNSPTTYANAPEACRSLSAYFLPPLSSLEWAKAMSKINPNDPYYPFPNPGHFAGDNESHKPSRLLNHPDFYVALSKKGDDPLRAKNWRLSYAHFPDPNSVFKTESFPPVDLNSYIGIIDHKGVPVVDLAEIANQNNLKKACFNQDNKSIKVVNDVTKECPSGTNLVTESVLAGSQNKMKSLWFMSEWVKNIHSGYFVIDSNLLAQAKKAAQNKQCKDNCQNVVEQCENTCESAEPSCQSACPANNPATPANENQACLDNCSAQKTNCKTRCSDESPACHSECDQQHALSSNNPFS